MSSHRSWYCLWTTISDILLTCTLSCHIHSVHSFKHIQDKQYSRMHISTCSFFFFFAKRCRERSCHTLPQWEEQGPVAGQESKIILPVPSVKHVGYIGSRKRVSLSLLPVRFSLSVHNKVLCYIRGERRTLQAGESSVRLKLIWSKLKFLPEKIEGCTSLFL